MNAEAESGTRDGTRRRTWGSVLLQVTFLVLAFLAMVSFSVVLAKVTLTPSPASEELVESNLRPGRSLRQYAEDYTFLAACKQAGGNLVLGMPFGVLLPILVPRRLRMIRMVLLTVLVIAIVELVQGALVQGRAFDVDDVILNTTGALLGYLLLGRRLSHRYHVLAEGQEREPERLGTDPCSENGWFRPGRARRARDRVTPAAVAGDMGEGRGESETEGWAGREAPARAEAEAEGQDRYEAEARAQTQGRYEAEAEAEGRSKGRRGFQDCSETRGRGESQVLGRKWQDLARRPGPR